MTGIRPALLVAAVVALAFGAGRCSAPPPAGPSRDSTAIMALADTIGALRVRLGAQSDTARAEIAAAAADTAAGSASLARGDSLRGRLPAPAPLPADADTAQLVTYLKSRETYLEDQLATEKARAAEYRKSATDFRRANDGSTRAASRWFSSYMTADSKLREIQDTLPKIAARIGQLEGQLRRIPRWEAGPLFEPGRAVPVGGYISRAFWRAAVHLQVTDGPGEPATLRIGAGLRF